MKAGPKTRGRCTHRQVAVGGALLKTRSAAQQAVEGGKVRLNGERTKPAKELRSGDQLVIHIGPYEWLVTVTRLSDKRGPAAVARTLFEEDEASCARREEQIALRRFAADPGHDRSGRPTEARAPATRALAWQ